MDEQFQNKLTGTYIVQQIDSQWYNQFYEQLQELDVDKTPGYVISIKNKAKLEGKW